MSKTTISDPRITVKVTAEMLALISDNVDHISEIPENVAKVMKENGYKLPTKIAINDTLSKSPSINIKLMEELCKDDIKEENNAEPIYQHTRSEGSRLSAVSYIYLNDLKWLNSLLVKLRRDHGCKLFLHEIIESSALQLPENEIIERSPTLEARCQKLREEQMNREYRKMTKSVDAATKHRPEDSIAYQMKAINAQIIAVLQFVLSVVAGFVFGFLGIELIIGNLDFGLRLLLGIMFALIIALAEIYFLAKKLNEYDDIGDTTSYPATPSKTTSKPHID